MILDGKCAAPKDPRPGISTFFCVYDKGHEGDHSWEHTPEKRRQLLGLAGDAASATGSVAMAALDTVADVATTLAILELFDS